MRRARLPSGAPNFRHGHRSFGKSSPTFMSWRAMIQRTTNIGHVAYQRYGGAGVSVCAPWLESFKAFLTDMGERPAGTTLDRFPLKDGNYEPGNCRWATKPQQSRNTKTNVLLSYSGKTQCIAAWAEEVGISRKRLGNRIRAGWDVELALTLPVVPCNERHKFSQKKPGGFT